MRRHKPLWLVLFVLFVLLIPLGLPAQEEISGVEARRAGAYWGLHFDLHPNAHDQALGADVSKENIRTLLERVQPDYVQYDCKGHPGWLGYPDSDVGPSAPGIVQDSLAVWREATRAFGIPLMVHFSGLWDSKALADHPEWAALDAQGEPHERAASVFGDYAEARMIPQLKEAIRRYDLDGAWVDGECWAAALDYSEAALAAWQAETGYEDAPRGPEDPHWYAWKQFQREAFEAYVADWIDELHAWRPDLALTSNWMYTTFAPKPVEANLDFLSGDYSHALSLYRARADARYLAQTGQPWDLMAWGFHRGPGQRRTSKPAVQLMQEAAVVLMQGGGFQVYQKPTRRGYIPEPIIAQLEQVGKFVRLRRGFCENSQTVPQIALLLSTPSYYEDSDRVFAPWGGEYDRLKGMLDALLGLQYSVDVLAEHQLAPKLDHYPLVVVPHASRLEEGFRDRLLAYVEAGGSLLLCGAPAVRHFPPEALGVEWKGPPADPGRAELACPTGVANVNGLWQAVSVKGARVVGERFPTHDTRRGGEPAATVHAWGEGQLAAVYGPIAAAYYMGHMPQLRDWIGRLVHELFPAPAVEVEGSKWLEVALRQTDQGQLAVHLLNTAGAPTSERFGFVDQIPPTGPITVRVGTAREPADVQWLPRGGEWFWTWSRGVLEVQLPGVAIHGALIIEPQAR